jgi:RNA-directed DNA polymerase
VQVPNPKGRDKQAGEAVKGNKWFSLKDKVYADRTLDLAWEKVRANAGACGVDCMSVEHFDKDSPRRPLEF